MTDPGNSVIKIDVAQVLHERLTGAYAWLKKPLAAYLKRLVHERELNELLESNAGKEGVDFCRGVLHDLKVTYRVVGSWPSERRIIVVSNHPLGGLDGIAMSCAVADQYGSQGLKFVVNDLLQAIAPMRPIFLPVNKHGAQHRQAVADLDEAFASDHPIIMFPAGLVSRRHQGRIADLPWHKMVVQKAVAYERDVVPVWFSGQNTNFFYRTARLRERLGIKLNLEMALLPREVFKSRGKDFEIVTGWPIPWQTLKSGHQASQQAAELREKVYELSY